MQETIVMSVGGSLIVPDAIDTTFLSSLKTLIEHETGNHGSPAEADARAGKRFIIIAGGGKTSRRYVDAATSVSTLDHDDMDWLGIHATRLNGHLLRTIFKDIAHPVMITNPDEVLDIPKSTSVIIAAGYRPGSSSDLQAVRIADRVHAKKMVNLSNIEYVYTADPHTNPNAEKIEDISWEAFRELIPKEWGPNLSSPFDPVAAKDAQNKDIEVACISGANLEALRNYLDDKPFIGTRIHN